MLCAHELQFARVDVHAHPGLAEMFQVSYLPMVLLFEQSKHASAAARKLLMLVLCLHAVCS